MKTAALVLLVVVVLCYLVTPPLGSGDATDPDVCHPGKRLCITDIKRTCLDTTDGSTKANITFRVRPTASELETVTYEVRADIADKVPGSWGRVNSSRGTAYANPGQERVETVLAEHDDLEITVSSLNPTVEIHSLKLSASATCP